VRTPTPAYLIDLAVIRKNCEALSELKARTGCRIVQALKAFALPAVFPLLRDHLDGCCASGLWEAQLAREFFGETVLTCGPVYRDTDTDLFDLSSHIVFNSLSHWQHWRHYALNHPRYQKGIISYGLRLNPQRSTGSPPIYDPCRQGSRLGALASSLKNADLEGLSGCHFHSLCDQNSDALAKTLEALDLHFGALLRRSQIRWLNMGGGHALTRPDYDQRLLVDLIKQSRDCYHLDEIWLEPGEAPVLNAGSLHSTVLDIFQSGKETVAILDVSATAHMPDVLEMPYRPNLTLDGVPSLERGTHRYQLGGSTCLAGDIIGPYSFHRPLKIGDRLIFQDMAQYTMVKTTYFNGIQHPSITLRDESGNEQMIRSFDYEDFKRRLM
tara:strand:+ start:3257 stop:4405 length:1149 start_codon:yes stop_codon:yes gene_type:complete